MRRLISLLAICGVFSALAACNVLPAQAQLPQLHDFGPLPVSDSGDPVSPVLVGQVTASTWLSDNTIHYRLLYSEPTTFRSYADNRWVSSPAELLDAGLRTMLPPGSIGKSGDFYLLDTQLLEFEQEFSSPRDAKVQLVLHASIRRASTGQVVAQRRFEMEQVSTPDVQGAVTGSAQLAQKMERTVADWANNRVSSLP
ncbi:MAG TPA: ABC-type transport auxiliary lipoprotein family protein [Gammaproteobacteria bacterium]|jgi:cholesterol transport system auxiliary component|nr:ABC-type transport auxiliary lipoprotein family protein [Gammaproteobacteria bacterium]